MKSFFTKAMPSPKESRLLEPLGNSGIFPITLNPRKIHVFGDALSRAPHTFVNVLEVMKIHSEDQTNSYESEKFCEAILKSSNADQIPDQFRSRKIDKLLPLFRKHGEKLLCEGKICIPRKSISTAMQLAHDAKTSGHFGYLKTISRLKNYH